MAQVSVIAKMTAKPEKRDELLNQLRALVEATEAESGTLQYSVNVSTTEPDVIWFYEVYTAQEALVAHGGSEAMKAAGPSLAEFLAGRVELHVCEPVAGKNLPS